MPFILSTALREIVTLDHTAQTFEATHLTRERFRLENGIWIRRIHFESLAFSDLFQLPKAMRIKGIQRNPPDRPGTTDKDRHSGQIMARRTWRGPSSKTLRSESRMCQVEVRPGNPNCFAINGLGFGAPSSYWLMYGRRMDVDYHQSSAIGGT
jgi:hypothetical protein